MDETWLPVVGAEGRYEVSDHGRVRSFVGRGGDITNAPLAVPILLSLKPNAQGYARVVISATGVRRSRLVHNLVLEAFVGPCPEGMEGCHWDNRPSNNRLSNLRWDTRLGNVADQKRHGVFRGAANVVGSQRGEASHRAVLTTEAVRCIRAEPAFVGVCAMLARAFEVRPEAIQKVRAGTNWRHVAQHL